LDPTQTAQILQRLFDAIERRIPSFLEDPTDQAISQGNAVMLAMDAQGGIHGRTIGSDPAKQQELGLVAWKKVQQVRLTRVATGRYEELAYARRLHWWKYGIPLPDFVGWDGGLPATLSDGSPLALAFSGFRGEKDVEILRASAAEIPEIYLEVPLPELNPVQPDRWA
jgi:glc operon protein GlcG